MHSILYLSRDLAFGHSKISSDDEYLQRKRVQASV